jgi:hypothetical protein
VTADVDAQPELFIGAERANVPKVLSAAKKEPPVKKAAENGDR